MTQLTDIITKLKKEFGVIQTLDKLKDVETIPFGIKSLDTITGGGGVPMGLLTEIFGAESNGKSSLCLSLVAEAQKKGYLCAYIDMELAMTKELAEKMGVDNSKLIIVRPPTGEEAFELMEAFMENGIRLIVVDSVSSLVPEDELEADYDQQSIGLQARLMSKGMRKIIGCAERNKAALVFTNQVRDEINKMGFGDKTTTSGGRALKYYSALRMKVARTGWISSKVEGESKKIGMSLQVTTVKNKRFQPQMMTTFDFYFDKGFDKDGDLVRYMEENGTITVLGRTYYHGDIEIGNKESAAEYLKKLSTGNS